MNLDSVQVKGPKNYHVQGHPVCEGSRLIANLEANEWPTKTCRHERLETGTCAPRRNRKPNDRAPVARKSGKCATAQWETSTGLAELILPPSPFIQSQRRTNELSRVLLQELLPVWGEVQTPMGRGRAVGRDPTWSALPNLLRYGVCLMPRSKPEQSECSQHPGRTSTWVWEWKRGETIESSVPVCIDGCPACEEEARREMEAELDDY